MKRIAIFYGTTEGQTSKIAEAIERDLARFGFSATIAPASEEVPWTFRAEDFDGVILGASVHRSRYPEVFRKRVAENVTAIKSRPSAFFSVCLGVLEKDNPKTQEEERMIVRNFLEPLGLTPVVRTILAGAIRYSKYGLVKKIALHSIAKKAGVETRMDRDYEFTDWEEVSAFVKKFVESLDENPRGTQKFPVDFEERECL